MNILQTIQRLLRDEGGATAVEYAMICAMLVLVIMTTVQGVASQTNIMWNRVGTTMQTATA